MTTRLNVLVAFAASTSAACTHAHPDADRAAWIQQSILADEQDIFYREYTASTGKMLKMGQSPYAFFRGTSRLMARDMARPPAGLDLATAFVTGGTGDVQLVGDPHLENLGTFLLGDELFFDWNDFDASTYGPYVFDLRRLALSFYIVGEAAEHSRTTTDDWLDAAQQVALGYADAVSSIAMGGPMPAAPSRILVDRLEDSLDEGDARSEIEALTAVEDSTRRLRRGDLEEPEGLLILSRLTDVSTAEVELLDAIVASYRPTASRPPAGRLLDRVRALGDGVSSYALPRYLLLYEGETGSPDDDELLEIREVLDAWPLEGVVLGPSALRHASNGERVASLRRRAQRTPHNDPAFGYASLGPRSFKLRSRSGYLQNLSTSRIERKLRDGLFDRRDLQELGYVAGQLLAAAHARPETASGTASAKAIAAALRGRIDEFADETRTFVELYGPRVIDDFRIFQLLLQIEGPTLGFREARRR